MDEAADFLLDLETALHSVSLPADITSRLIRRAANRLGASIDTAIFQSYVAADLRSSAGHVVRIKYIPVEAHWNLWRTQQLTDLAKALGEGRIGVGQGRAELERIMAQPTLYPKAFVVLGYCIYGAVVTARIGGSAADMIAAAVLGLLSGAINFGAGRSRSIQLQQSFLAGLFGALITIALCLVLPINAGKSLLGGLVLLIPGMVLTIAIHELANDALESGVLRLLYGLLRFLMLGFGIAAALRLWHLFGTMPPGRPTTALPALAIVALLVPAAFALVICLQARFREVGWVFTAILLAYGTQELTKLVVGEAGSPFTAAFALGVAGQLYQRVSGRSTQALFVVPGLLQLTPGFLGTRVVLTRLVDATQPGPVFIDVLLITLQLVTGLFVAGILLRDPRVVGEMPATPALPR